MFITESRSLIGRMKIPMPTEFAEKLVEYRQRWPRDGYFDSHPRFLATYNVFHAFYTQGAILDVGGWPGDFACALAMLRLPVLVLDKDCSRPTSKVRDEASGEYVLGGTTTLREKCDLYGVQCMRCD